MIRDHEFKASMRVAALAGLALMAAAMPLRAGQLIEEVPFDGETITVVETDDGLKSVRLGDRELGSNYYAGIERVTNVAGVPVALFYLGDGGNACPPSTLIVWRSETGTIEAYNHGTDCGSPAPAISDRGLVFVPYLRPGASDFVQLWTPSEGISTIARIEYAPQPGTTWLDLAPANLYHPSDFFRNEAIYNQARSLTGPKDFANFALGLSVASAPEITGGLWHAAGCIPHNCGGGDSLFIADPAGQRLYLAQQTEYGIEQWPAADQWPQAALSIFEAYAAERQR